MKTLEVPDVSTKRATEAANYLTDYGFNVSEDFKYVPSDNIEEGYVVKTSPEVGRKLKEGSTITIYLSSGPESFEMDDYVGKNYIEVQTILKEKYNCNTIIEKEVLEKPDKKKENTILRTDPEAGTKVRQGSSEHTCSVTLYIPEKEVTYPNFLSGNYTLDDIKKFCDDNNLKLQVKYEEKANVKEGTIIGQSRPEGTVVLPGITFTITIASVPEEVSSINESE